MVILNPMTIEEDEQQANINNVAVAYSRNRREASQMVGHLDAANIDARIEDVAVARYVDGSAILVAKGDFIAASESMVDYLHAHQDDDAPFEDDEEYEEEDDEFDNDDDFGDYDDEEDYDDEDYEEEDDF